VAVIGRYRDDRSLRARAGALLHPGRLATGFSLRSLDALCAGLPVLAGPRVAAGFPPVLSGRLLGASLDEVASSPGECLAGARQAASGFAERWRQAVAPARRQLAQSFDPGSRVGRSADSRHRTPRDRRAFAWPGDCNAGFGSGGKEIEP
jgi:hypothetical protein